MTQARTTTISTNSLLVVHGRDFKPPPDPLKDICCAALRAGIARDYPEHLDAWDKLAIELGYYGDLSNTLLTGSGRQYDEQLDIRDRRNALDELRKITARKRFGIRQYDCLPGKSAVPEFFANLVSPLCNVLGLTRPMVSRMAPDFGQYLRRDSDYGVQVRDRVRAALCEQLQRGNRVMLMTHGTGCVVAYDVLWQLTHDERFTAEFADSKVDTWVTLGAPLGDNAIRKRLLGATGESMSYPGNVINWHNVSAEDDYTCHDNTLADDFKSMLQQRVVSKVHDYRIYNLAVRYGKSNPHSSVGYFIHPRVSKIVADWLRPTAIDTDPIYTL